MDKKYNTAEVCTVIKVHEVAAQVALSVPVSARDLIVYFAGQICKWLFELRCFKIYFWYISLLVILISEIWDIWELDGVCAQTGTRSLIRWDVKKSKVTMNMSIVQ